MSNLVAFPDHRKAREEASLWLARLDRGLSAEERTEIRQWLDDSTHHRALVDMARLWRGMDVMSVLAELFPLSQSNLKRPPRRGFPVVVLAAAAAVCIVAVSALFFAGLTPSAVLESESPTAPLAVATARYSTGVGETRTVKPGDGSAITLNTNSLIAVLYAPHGRDVYLTRGEASFEVAHDASRPFNVHAGKRVFQAVGTAFNVRVLSDDNIELTVTEGKVKVLTERRGEPNPAERRSGDIAPVETTVTAQETATVQPDAETVRRLEPAEMDARLAWQRGMLVFQGEPLETVLSEVDRYTDTEFVLADEALRSVRVGGYFRAGDIDGLLIALRENFRIDSRRDAQNRIILTPAARR